MQHFRRPDTLACHLTQDSGGAERYVYAQHLAHLGEVIRQAATTPNSRVIVSMAPRHGKSSTVSHWAPVWYLSAWPDKRVILASYEADFAAMWGRKVRNTVQHYAPDLTFGIAQDSSAANRWDTTEGGGMVTVGVGGPLLGRGADLLLLDDPVKNWEQATSPVYRDKLWDWFRSTAYTRVEPGGSVVIVMQRWHEDDLTGRLLAEQASGGEEWQVVRFPAIAEEHDALGRSPGEALWPMRYDVASLERIKRAVGTYVWAALYQQRPAPIEGGIFRGDWLQYVDKAPKQCEWVRWWDTAATEAGKGDPDFSVGALVGRAPDGRCYVGDVVRVRETPLRLELVVKHTARRDGLGVKIRMGQEPGSSGKAMIAHYASQVLQGYQFSGIRETGSKVERARGLAACAEAGDLHLVRGAWNRDYLDELCLFPNARHDDQVDATAGAFGVLTGVLEQRQAEPRIWSIEL